MEPVRCAVVGLGVIGTEHAAVLASLAGADLAICCDIDEGAADRVPEGVPFTTELSDVLSIPGLDCLLVCTPEGRHREPVERSLRSGIATFCEKPLASNLEDADALIRLGRETSVPLRVGHTVRFDPRYLEVRAAISDGRLGSPIQLFARRNSWEDEGSVVRGRTTLPLYVGVHDLDIFRWMAGPIDRVYGEASGLGLIGPGIADTVVATVRFASGAVGILELSWAAPRGSGIQWDTQLEVVGTAGSAYVDLGRSGLSVFSRAGTPFPDAVFLPRAYGIPSGLLKVQDEHLLRCLQDGATWPVSLLDAREAVAAALAIDRSIELGRPVSPVPLATGSVSADAGGG